MLLSESDRIVKSCRCCEVYVFVTLKIFSSTLREMCELAFSVLRAMPVMVTLGVAWMIGTTTPGTIFSTKWQNTELDRRC